VSGTLSPARYGILQGFPSSTLLKFLQTISDNEARRLSERVSEQHHTVMNTQQIAPELPPINKRTHTITRFILRQLERNLDVQIRVHGLTTPFTRGGGIVVANHFTRLETFVIPFVLYREVQIIVRVLAAPILFTHHLFGEYLTGIGALPTNYPHKYELIARDILRGGWWLIFPEGSMIKDRKVVERGRLLVSNEGGTLRRPPHSGAAIIALTVQRYKDALRHALRHATQREQICQALGLPHMHRTDLEAMLYRPTSIVPLSMTYYPLHPQENLLKSLITRLVPTLMQSDMGHRLVEELTVEGSMLLKGVEIDMRLGQPWHIQAGMRWRHDWRLPWVPSPWRGGLHMLRSWQSTQRYANRLEPWATRHGHRQRRRARQMTHAYMRAIYQLTTVNMDHVLSGMLLIALHTYQRCRLPLAELKYRVYIAAQALQSQQTIHLHPHLTTPEILYALLTDQPHPGIDNFARRATASHLLTCADGAWILAAEQLTNHRPFGVVRLQNFMQVCYNEIEPLPVVMQTLHYAIRVDLGRQRQRLAQDMFAHEEQLYMADRTPFLAVHAPKMPVIPPAIGRPVFLPGVGKAGAVGVLLMHGYSASPGEMLPLAYHLHTYGLTVYVVRLRGHGTSPYDLQQRSWQEWYASVLRGYRCLQAVTEVQFAGGMSTGGALALYLAAQRLGPLRGIFAIGAPIKLQQRFLRLVPVVKTVRDFVRAEPENPCTNYTYHPLQAVRQLIQFIEEYQQVLSQVTVPTLLVQARGDPTVHPDSAQYIYDRLQLPDKKILWKAIDRHVIVSARDTEVHDDILTFLQQLCPLIMPVEPLKR
jgi:esterase/lipase/1-acyl-sn-glycerol-3-phosphate acyltransferase